MRKIILTVVGAALIAVSTAQVAAAAERHHARKVERAPAASEQFRNSNNSVAGPAQPSWYSGGFSAPAGH
jgi:hypothetical protein